MKIEVDFDDGVIHNAVEVWVQRAAADALDAYLTTSLAHRIQKETKLAVDAKLDELTKCYNFVPDLSDPAGIVSMVEKWTVAHLRSWSQREGAKAAKEALKREAAKQPTGE